MPSEIFLSNDAAGFDYSEETFHYNFISETSVHGVSATRIAGRMMARAGKVVSVAIGVVAPALSASGFVSGTVDATLRINSAAVCSTDPSIPMAGSAGAVGRKSTNAGGGVSAVVNPVSATFSKGDQLSLDYNARSVGSAAAGSAGVGFYATFRVRYDAA